MLPGDRAIWYLLLPRRKTATSSEPAPTGRLSPLAVSCGDLAVTDGDATDIAAALKGVCGRRRSRNAHKAMGARKVGKRAIGG